MEPQESDDLRGALRDAARCLRQELELARLFGWDVPIAPLRAPQNAATAAAAPAATAAAPPRPPAQASPEERARREVVLEPLRREVAACTRCALARGRTQTVFGTGNPCARLMFVGEAPGFDEDRQGEPFVGAAGRLLNDIIRAMGLAREDVYIANVVKCRPPGNRQPEAEEMAACLPYLRQQLATVQPEVVCALGSVAARGLLGGSGSVGRLRGTFHDLDGIPVRVTYHPAYLLRRPEDKRKTWEDVQAVMARLGLPLSRRP